MLRYLRAFLGAAFVVAGVALVTGAAGALLAAGVFLLILDWRT